MQGAYSHEPELSPAAVRDRLRMTDNLIIAMKRRLKPAYGARSNWPEAERTQYFLLKARAESCHRIIKGPS
jgi:hypothetical protein